MFCPKCGQSQAFDEVRFCARCGLQLEAVKDLITTGGISLQREDKYQTVSRWKKPGVKTGAKILFLSFVLAPIFIALSFIEDELAPLLLFPFSVFFVGLAWAIYSLIFDESPFQSKKHSLKGQPPNYTPLFAQQEPPKALPTQSIKTGEIVEPSSVTENTTKLFETKRNA
jgi:hypothetical protein